MSGVHPIGDMPKVLDRYAKAVTRATPKATKAAAEVALAITKASGARYHVKGRRGGSFPLSAKMESMRVSAGTGKPYAIIKADPVGFWKLVEFGSYKKPGGYWEPKRRRRGGKLLGGGNLQHPMRRVHHSGFGGWGKPWEEAMHAIDRPASTAYHIALLEQIAKAA